MDIYKRTGSYFFVTGALLTVFAGVFPLDGFALGGIMAAVIFLGMFSAILNVEGDQYNFIVAASGYLVLAVCAQVLLGGTPIVESIMIFLKTSALFVGSMLTATTLRAIAEYGSQSDVAEEVDVVDRVEQIAYTNAEKAWHFVVFLAVSASFIIVLLDLFFVMQEFDSYIFFFDIMITGIFFIDLIVLYRRAGSFLRFVRTSWLDIIATIPFYQILRVAKLVRLIRLVEMLKLNKTLKFFSERSGVRHYVQGDTPAQPMGSASGTGSAAQTPAAPVAQGSSAPTQGASVNTVAAPQPKSARIAKGTARKSVRHR